MWSSASKADSRGGCEDTGWVGQPGAVALGHSIVSSMSSRQLAEKQPVAMTVAALAAFQFFRKSGKCWARAATAFKPNTRMHPTTAQTGAILSGEDLVEMSGLRLADPRFEAEGFEIDIDILDGVTVARKVVAIDLDDDAARLLPRQYRRQTVQRDNFVAFHIHLYERRLVSQQRNDGWEVRKVHSDNGRSRRARRGRHRA